MTTAIRTLSQLEEAFLTADNLADLLDLALDELEISRGVPDVVIDMGQWCNIEPDKMTGRPLCYCCLAGSILRRLCTPEDIKRAQLQPGESKSLVEQVYNRGGFAHLRCRAINYLRTGEVMNAASELFSARSESFSFRDRQKAENFYYNPIRSYPRIYRDSEHANWVVFMRKFAGWLREDGL